MDDLYQCRVCLTFKTRTDFSVNANNKHGIDKRCKSCRREHYKNNRDSILVKIKQHEESNREAVKERRRVRYQENKLQIQTRARNKRNEDPDSAKKEKIYRHNRKCLAYGVLGNACKICGESDHDLLCVDHVNNDGSQERKRGTSRIKIFGEILKNSDKYQLLCYNCNQKKQITYHLFREPVGQGELKECVTCRTLKDRSLYKSDKKYPDGLYYECVGCTYNRVRILKNQAFVKLGKSSCAKCGCDDSDVLSVDRVNEDGYARRSREGTGIGLYANIIYDRIDTGHLQVLCFNCNLKKHRIYVGSGERPDKFETNGSSLSQITSDSLVLKEFEFRDIEFKLLDDLKDGVVLLENYHYAGYGRYGTVNFGAFLKGELIALAKLSNPVRLEVASSMGLGYSEVLELDRFCINPYYQKKNLASYFMSRLIKHIRNNNLNITHLVSFADPSHGHQGTIYKASNWKTIKITTRSYEYIDGQGNIYHKKTIYNQARQLGLKELEYSQSRGLVRSYTLRKIKYSYKLR